MNHGIIQNWSECIKITTRFQTTYNPGLKMAVGIGISFAKWCRKTQLHHLVMTNSAVQFAMINWIPQSLVEANSFPHLKLVGLQDPEQQGDKWMLLSEGKRVGVRYKGMHDRHNANQGTKPGVPNPWTTAHYWAMSIPNWATWMSSSPVPLSPHPAGPPNHKDWGPLCERCRLGRVHEGVLWIR